MGWSGISIHSSQHVRNMLLNCIWFIRQLDKKMILMAVIKLPNLTHSFYFFPLFVPFIHNRIFIGGNRDITGFLPLPYTLKYTHIYVLQFYEVVLPYLWIDIKTIHVIYSLFAENRKNVYDVLAASLPFQFLFTCAFYILSLAFSLRSAHITIHTYFVPFSLRYALFLTTAAVLVTV